MHKKEVLKRSLHEFIKDGWHVLEPDTDFIDNWHVEAICEHLEAVSAGRIRRLLVNIAPGTLKSLSVSVFFPAWMWVHNPGWRSIFASYAMPLSTRDSGKCRDLIQSDWYQKTFKPQWKLKGDQNVKTWFANTARGVRQALTVGGGGTGWKADCVRGDTMIATADGEIRADALAMMTNPPPVWSFNHKTTEAELCPLSAIRVLPDRHTIGVATGRGLVLYCTNEHRIYTEEGYKTAEQINKGAQLVTLHLPTMRRTNGEGREEMLDVLQKRDRSLDNFDVCRMRELFQSSAVRNQETQTEGAKEAFLLSDVRVQILPEQAKNYPEMSNVFKSDREKVQHVLFRGMQTISPKIRRSGMRLLRPAVSAERSEVAVLRKPMLKCCSFTADDGERESALQRWKKLLQAICQNAPADFASGLLLLRCVWQIRRDRDYEIWPGAVDTQDSSPKQKDGRQSAREYHHTLQKLPPERALQSDTVSSVAGVSKEAHTVYDFQVEKNHNFFANGILVHNCIVVDDPHDIKAQLSENALEDVDFWWHTKMSTRLADPRSGPRVCIMQRLHERDLSGRILARGNVEHLCLPTEFDPEERCETSIGFKDPRTEPGELMFPQLFTKEVVEEAREDLGEYGFASQHDQKPSPPGGGDLKQVWWRFWYPRDLENPPAPWVTRETDGSMFEHPQMELPESFDMQLQSWDMTFKGKKKSAAAERKSKRSYVTGQLWATAGHQRFLLDQARDRWSFTEAVDQVRLFSAEWPLAERKLVEDAANGAAICDTLQDEIGGFDLIPVKGDKVARALAASHSVKGGFVYLPHPAIYAWVKGFLFETTMFPKGANNDQVDTCSQALIELRGSGFVFV